MEGAGEAAQVLAMAPDAVHHGKVLQAYPLPPKPDVICGHGKKTQDACRVDAYCIYNVLLVYTTVLTVILAPSQPISRPSMSTYP